VIKEKIRKILEKIGIAGHKENKESGCVKNE